MPYATTSTQKRKITAVSLTPLIDVVFILLMFFMLTASFVNYRQITMASPALSPGSQAELTQDVQLSASGKLYLLPAGTLLEVADINNHFDMSRAVILRPSPEARVQQLVTKLVELKESGISKVNIGTPYPGSFESDRE